MSNGMLASKAGATRNGVENMPMTRPSGSARATTRRPTVPIAPGLFSTITGSDEAVTKRSAMSLPTMSGGVPGADETISRLTFADAC